MENRHKFFKVLILFLKNKYIKFKIKKKMKISLSVPKEKLHNFYWAISFLEEGDLKNNPTLKIQYSEFLISSWCNITIDYSTYLALKEYYPQENQSEEKKIYTVG